MWTDKLFAWEVRGEEIPLLEAVAEVLLHLRHMVFCSPGLYLPRI